MTVRSEKTNSPSRRFVGAALTLAMGLSACGGIDASLEDVVPDDTLAMADDSTSTTAVEADPNPEDPAAADAPTTVPMTAPDPPASEAPEAPGGDKSPATDPPATDSPATDPPATDPPADPPVAEGELAQAEAESFRLLNELRASLGLSALSPSIDMDAFARNWSQTMATTGDFEHSNGPYGENIAWNSQGSLSPADAAAAMHQMWVNSPGHYANMTDDSYTLAGVGFYKDASGWHATHVFDR